MNEIKIFCPATIANLSCGFDVLGLCLETAGDEMIIRKSDIKGIRITKIVGADLPLETEKNVAGVSALAMLEAVETEFGFEIEIYKHIKAGSGIGSSAASSAGAVFGINELLGRPFTRKELVLFAMQGEKLASGNAHADNVAPALLGGFTLVRSSNPLDIIKIESPSELYAIVVHPQIELKTSDARSVLKQTVSLKSAIMQWGNVGGLIAGLYTKDYDLIGRSLHDEIVEPLRSVLIPGFDLIKQTALENGALGSGISGSGPSIFALSKGKETADKIAKAMSVIYEEMYLPYEIHVSKVNDEGIKIIAP
ncbi:homoserine kinase [Flavobacterium sp. GSP27]|uniref:Homoserine kinase n=1 Tax=Flavobacterium bomense TaxID=2497483 RepID=A0A432CML9_9FLAO|nr:MULTISPECIES: homoserine kinase [Flavobacterium]RTY94777.1 homoserine kinase [Flavobacterium sp. GSN2]RTY67700.1 homoserine kinase [Flavobacterium sp. LB2P53]RTY73466.1 homoserine kinase [Flavobacterium sp. LS1R10]RTY81579.1 homoserine kinase [Flavobacterium sp. ZB4P23]RTY81758.1 homoserine kinase [Flavobacterium sp. LS1P28]